MKALINAVLMTAMVVFLAAPRHAKAQVVKGDTMFVYTMDGTQLVNDVIMGDTTATGARADSNRVYVLFGSMSPDSVYYWDTGMPVYWNFTIVGYPDPKTGMPPVISPVYAANGALPTWFMRSYGPSSKVTYDNVFFECTSPDGVNPVQQIVWGSGEKEQLTIDHCVFSDMLGSNMNAIGIGGKNMKIFVTNSEFRNIQAPQIWGASLCWTGQAQEDTILFQNNTCFNMERAIDGSPGGPHNAMIINHNTIFCTGDTPLDMPQATHSIIKNNIFFNTFAAGVDSTYMMKGFYNAPGRIPGIILLDSLRSLAVSPWNLTEASRKDSIYNNVYCWDPKLLQLWKDISDTTHDPGLVTRPVWMDSITTHMFTDKTNWPNLYMANNDSVDPGFNQQLVDSTVDSLVKWVGIFWSDKTTGNMLWWQEVLNPITMFNKLSGWTSAKQTYPVPENLQYSKSDQLVDSRGFSIGDLNWYPAQYAEWKAGGLNAVESRTQVPAKFALSQNYPNPFNPTTDIKVSLKQPGVMSLKVYNVLGQLVQVVAEGFKSAGNYTYNVNMEQFASGVYFYTLRQGSNSITRKMLLLK